MSRNWIETLSKATLQQPSKYVPSWATGPAPHAALLGGLGALGGYYLFPKIAPYISKKIIPERAGIAGLAGGGLLGLALASPELISAYGGRSLFGPASKSVAELKNDALKDALPKQASEKSAAFWDTPSIDTLQAQDDIRKAVYNGSLDPVSATQMELAFKKKQNQPFITPGEAAGALTGVAMTFGKGFLPAYAAGRLGGAALGGLANIDPSTRGKLAIGAGVMAGVANLLWSK